METFYREAQTLMKRIHSLPVIVSYVTSICEDMMKKNYTVELSDFQSFIYSALIVVLKIITCPSMRFCVTLILLPTGRMCS